MNDIEKLSYTKIEKLPSEDIRKLIIAGLEQVKMGKTKDFNIVCDRLEEKYTKELIKIYGSHLKSVILYGSYARGDFSEESDIDIMILVDLSDIDIKKYRHQLSDLTYEFNMEYDLDIKPIAKNLTHYQKWLGAYPFYSNIHKEGVKLFDVA